MNLQPQPDLDDDDFPLLPDQSNETPSQQFIRQRKMAQQACDLGRKLTKEGEWQKAAKELAKAVMTFEYILKNNPKMGDFKTEITSMMKQIILPAYSNLSLCYYKLGNWQLVMNFSNQVLISDKDNVKNMFRRGVARKFCKMPEEAIQDFQNVMKMDKQMQGECRKQILECKEVRRQIRKKDRELANNLISGYAQEKPEPKPEAFEIPVLPPKAQYLATLPWWQRALICVGDTCRKLFNRN